MWAKSGLRVAALTVLGIIVTEAGISLVARWPHQFAGHGDRSRMLADFVGSGTALAPPLVLIVVLGLIAYGVQRADRWGTAAAILLIPVSAVMAIGAFGEATAAATPDVPRAAQLAGGGAGVALSLALLILAIASLASVRHRAPAQSS